MYFSTLAELVGFYADEEWRHIKILNHFYVNTDNDDVLKRHRDWVEWKSHGYGDREFHWLHKLLVDSMPQSFKFLEIGVFKGQVVSLIQLLANREGKDVSTFGITPLSGVQDNVCASHGESDYYQDIKTIHDVFSLDFNKLTIIKGLSQDQDVIEKAKSYAEYDMIYIDGNHEYNPVLTDIANYSPMLKIGGYLIMDDSSNYLRIPNCRWKGVEQVSMAVRDSLEKNDGFKHLAAVGHNRIFLKLK